MQQELTERQQRQAVMYHFELQARPRFSLEIRERLTNYRYSLHDLYTNTELLAMVLAESFDFYEYRLNRCAARVDLVICQKHNAVLPVRVLEIETGFMFTPGAVPPLARPDRKKRSKAEARLFVSMLLAGIDGANEELLSMPARTRQRYIALRDQYLRAKVGRPRAS